jgi:hypothetical protein
LRLAHERYEGGVTSFLEVLDTERQFFSTELTLVQAQLAERLAIVRLCRALGGGWQLQPTAVLFRYTQPPDMAIILIGKYIHGAIRRLFDLANPGAEGHALFARHL